MPPPHRSRLQVPIPLRPRGLAPDRGEPRLLRLRQARRSVVVAPLPKAHGGDVRSPCLEIMEAAVAATSPTLLVAAPRVRAEQHSAGSEGRNEVPEDPGELAARHVEQRCVREDPLEADGRQVEREEVLVQSLSARPPDPAFQSRSAIPPAAPERRGRRQYGGSDNPPLPPHRGCGRPPAARSARDRTSPGTTAPPGSSNGIDRLHC